MYRLNSEVKWVWVGSGFGSNGSTFSMGWVGCWVGQKYTQPNPIFNFIIKKIFFLKCKIAFSIFYIFYILFKNQPLNNYKKIAHFLGGSAPQIPLDSLSRISAVPFGQYSYGFFNFCKCLKAKSFS